MTKITCADGSCKYNSDDWICTRKDVNLACSDVMTVNDGRQHFYRCKNYEESEFAKKIKQSVLEYLQREKEWTTKNI